MKIILFLLANLFLVNSLPQTNKIGTTLLQNNSVDIPDQETEYDSVNIDDETDDNDDGILVPEKETEQIEIKLNNVTFNNLQLEIIKNSLKEIYEEIKGFVNEKYKKTKTDIDNVRNECNTNSVKK